MSNTRIRRWSGVSALALILGTALMPMTPAGASKLTPPTQGMTPQSSVGKGEGQLNLIAWVGYAQSEWVKPFTAATGCKVHVNYPNTSSEMVALMRNGGGHQYDLVSASGDADLRLIYGGDVKPVNVHLIPSWKRFYKFLQAPGFNTINGVHYGVSYEFGPNVLLYSKKTFKSPPTSWSVLYNPKYKGKITVPDNPIQIADAALFLSKVRPSLGITDPYELTQTQFNASVALLTEQHPLIRKYWDSATQEINLFQSGAVVAGAAWPYQTNTLQAAKAPVAQTIPSEGATGWADTWLLATNAPDPNCAYKWMRWVTTPKVQAEEALYFGETPANTQACAIMNQIQKGGCALYNANAPESYFSTIKFWKTPVSTCDNGKNNCVDFNQWQSAWTRIIG
ncbi:MAG TPA: ABC transporter substrate-binding protein [Acidimicrobiales bacterium]|nr:ABC transporter substrate-binding protein [Acidimicrobiales bacterium]